MHDTNPGQTPRNHITSENLATGVGSNHREARPSVPGGHKNDLRALATFRSLLQLRDNMSDFLVP